MSLQSPGWTKDVVLDDVELYHFSTEGERKLAASLIRASIDDMVALQRHMEHGKPLSRGETVAELSVGRDWVMNNSGVLSFEECCNICAPDLDWRSVQQAILMDPAGALDRIRNPKRGIVDNEVGIPQTEIEIEQGHLPITTGRLALGLLEMIQGELDLDVDVEGTELSVRPFA